MTCLLWSICGIYCSACDSFMTPRTRTEDRFPAAVTNMQHSLVGRRGGRTAARFIF
jgi:hypothetical protein